MSTGICGIIYTDIHDVAYITKLSFYFEKLANELEIGTKIGGNISKLVYDKYYEKQGIKGIIFELTDSPLDIYAEDLFALEYGNGSIDLYNRMKRVQNLLENVLSYSHVVGITLEIDYLFGEAENTVSVKAADFTKKIIPLYQKCKVILPAIKFYITK